MSLADAWFGGLSWRDTAAYVPVQVAGCIGGAVVANLMFALPAVSISAKDRASAAHFLSEIVATLGLIVLIFAAAPLRRSRCYETQRLATGTYIRKLPSDLTAR